MTAEAAVPVSQIRKTTGILTFCSAHSQELAAIYGSSKTHFTGLVCNGARLKKRPPRMATGKRHDGP
jgi:hypothetical protein